ncbi:hypothetical protein Cob_v006560 [Colletotrichum orbiculare MAFF 240422]|uniref:Uncharacterized protein n=1 Tax=Colletotrichum orbiculare (strain 104-T / ATCC 96160 / CBS 514.97 / LARS 414 / MAFF 240422) TaxID=1213857 RepID=A0A484FUI1_COLOR|nr:hypothetical protein Cob_v006560 [Colletotrichum orbiculare MAFF 240422]
MGRERLAASPRNPGGHSSAAYALRELARRGMADFFSRSVAVASPLLQHGLLLHHILPGDFEKIRKHDNNE